jgi:hypothetical protein
MSRFILIIALFAVGYDAYAHQGFYTRTAVGHIETGWQQISTYTAENANRDGNGARDVNGGSVQPNATTTVPANPDPAVDRPRTQ